MTNFQKWQTYMAGVPSPQNYVDWSFYYLIAACLQRRVWCPPDHQRCYPNMYVTLVGPPGVGKGLCTNKVLDLLRHHKLEDVVSAGTQHGVTDEKEKVVANAIQQEDLRAAEEQDSIGRASTGANSEKALLYPIASDAVTYEALVQCMAGCYRRVNYVGYDEKLQKERMMVYGHSSLCFCLDEISSLFRKKTEDVVNFLLQTYNCGENYEYRTKTQGKDRIRRVCLNFMGGTTPDFMQSTFSDELLNQGFSSRTFYVYANKNRFAQFFLPELTDEQRKIKQELLDHIRKLYHLFGCVKLSAETRDFLQKWLEKDAAHPELRANKSMKLTPYYARKQIHIMKLSMALHFGESLDMSIPTETFKRAIEILDTEERNMHLALTLEGDNPLAKTARRVVEFLRTSGKQTFPALMIEFITSARKSEMEEILEHLMSTDAIVTIQERDEHTDQTRLMYQIKK